MIEGVVGRIVVVVVDVEYVVRIKCDLVVVVVVIGLVNGVDYYFVVRICYVRIRVHAEV